MTVPRIRFPKLNLSLRTYLWIVSVALGAMEAFRARHGMNSDGISYVDLASAYARGDWSQGLNRQWSPLYPFLLSMAFRSFKPTPYQEFSVVHFINFLIYILALGGFDFMLRELQGYRQRCLHEIGTGEFLCFPDWAIGALGYGLFVVSSLQWITVGLVTPDMCVAAAIYFATGLMLWIARRPASWMSFAGLGFVLGFGFLAKASMLPLAFVYFVLGLYLVQRSPYRVRMVPCVLALLVAFLLVASPLIAGFVKVYGRLSVGDNGKLNYAWHINRLPYIHWRGEPPTYGRPLHPTRKILAHPPVYEFATSTGETYPPWYDPAYWFEGVKPRFDLRAHLRNLAMNARVLARMQVALQAALGMGITILVYLNLGYKQASFLKAVLAHSFVIVPALAAVMMFLLIHLEPRYIGAFVTTFWLGLLASMTLPSSADWRRLFDAIAVALLAVLIIVAPELPYRMVRSVVARGEVSRHLHWEIAEGLREMGLRSGDKVAIIGFAFGAYWARLARVQIIAEIPVAHSEDDSGVSQFWAADEGVRRKVFSLLQGAGVQMVVADYVNSGSAEGWRQIGQTNKYVYVLRPKMP